MPRSPVQIAAESLEAVWRLAARQAAAEWRALPFAGLRSPPAPRRVATFPSDLRPADAALGAAMLEGRIVMAGETLEMGPGGDPWDRPSPSRAFAVELHRFAWASALIAQGEPGAREALRLALDWERLFGRGLGFAWTDEVLERRVYNLACGLRPLLEVAAEPEQGRLLASLARQAARLLAVRDQPSRAAERAAVAAIAAGALEGTTGSALLKQSLTALAPAVKVAVLADGGHRTRSPERGLELLFDLLTLDAVLQERGRATPPAVSGAMDRLTTAARFFTQADGRLPAFHGGTAVEPARVRAALALAATDAALPADYAPHSGFQRLTARTLQIMVDAGPPAEGDWSRAAHAQPMAIEVLAGRERLVLASGSGDPVRSRLTPAGSTASVAEDSLGVVLDGFRSRALGPRLASTLDTVDVRRNADAEETLWIELSHQGWVARHGFIHERRLFVDVQADELRGEDKFTPASGQPTQTPFAVRFHLAPGVEAAAGPDGRHVGLRTPGGQSWSLRNDADTVAVEPAADGRGAAVVLRGHIRPQGGARLRWKLSPTANAG